MSEVEIRLEMATAVRQEFEQLVRFARQRGRPQDYEAAMDRAIHYVTIATGIIALLQRQAA
jgi:hypothetical protein